MESFSVSLDNLNSIRLPKIVSNNLYVKCCWEFGKETKWKAKNSYRSNSTALDGN